MKILLLCVGRTGYEPFRQGIERYVKRIPHYVPFEMKELPDVKTSRTMTEDRQRAAEGEMIMQQLTPTDCVVLLDERGARYTSEQFARQLDRYMVTLPGRLVYIIGGPYGFSEQMYARANSKMSLSDMTFPHEMVRMFIVEQIYRAMTILRGEPYHH